MIGRLVATMALCMTALPAMAQNAEPVQVEGWWIAPVAPAVCQIASSFQGNTMMTFIDAETQQGMITLGDSSWQLAQGERYDASFSWDGWKTSHALTLRSNQGSSDLWIVAAMTDPAINRSIREAKRIAIRVPALHIDGSAVIPNAAMSRLASCRGG